MRQTRGQDLPPCQLAMHLLYAKGMSTRDIEDHMSDIYGIDVSAGMVSKVTDKILPLVAEFAFTQNNLKVQYNSSSH